MPVKNALLVLLLFLGLGFFSAQEKSKVVIPHVAPTIKFTENKGQWDSPVLMRATLPGGGLFIEKNAITFNFYDQAKLAGLHTGGWAKGTYKDFIIKGQVYKVIFENAEPQPLLEKKQMVQSYENFYLGNDRSRWQNNVRSYEQVWLRGLYKGVDYEILAASGSAKYNFHVSPGADPSVISMRFDGVNDISIRKGKLHVKTIVNEVTEEKPYAYQLINGEIKEVPCEFRLKEKTVTFVFPKGYDKSVQLVIDPVLVFSAQIGSAADNFGMTATFDPSGNLYSAGTVYSAGYPHVTGSYDNTFNNPAEYGRTDVFVTKYNASGTSLIYSTYLGGSSTEVCSSMIVDENNFLCLYGATGSNDFPVTNGAAYMSFSGGTNIGFISNGSVFPNGSDIYICKFNSTGSALAGSTYFGGSGNDGINYLGAVVSQAYSLFPASGNGVTNVCGYDSLMMNYGDQYRGEIQIDSLNNIYICSSTRSSNLPIVGGFDNSLGGKQDGVVAKFSPNLTTLLYSTYLGGSQIDCGNAIFVTATYEIFATGGTCSADMPGTTGAHSSTYNGGKTDGYLTKINANGSLNRTTYIGTSNYDNSFFVQCDKYNEVYVYGQSLGNMPVQAVGSLPVYSVTNTHQFICCYNNSLSSRNLSTVFGSKTTAFDISPSAFAIDECNGNIYLSGWGGPIIGIQSPMSGMPLLNATQGTTTGFDFYMMALKPHASALLYGSYYGGGSSQEHVDGGTSRFDRKGVIYQSVCAGCGSNDDFPISSGAWPCPGSSTCPDPNKSGNCNNGVFKINFDLQEAVASINTTTNSGCAPLTVTLVNAYPGTSYEWDLGNGNTTSVIASPVVTFNTPGTYTVSLFVKDTTMCITEDTYVTSFQVLPNPQLGINLQQTPCTNTISLTANMASGVTGISWNLGNGGTSTATSLTYTYPIDGVYNITLSGTSGQGCFGSFATTVGIVNFTPQASGGGTVCSGLWIPLHAAGGTSYSWSPGGSLNDASSPDPLASPAVNTIYTVTVRNTNYGQNCSASFTTGVELMPSPTADFTYSLHACGGSAVFTDNSSSDVVSWYWSFGQGDTSTFKNPNYYFEDGGNKTVTLTTTNAYGCTSKTNKSFNVADAPVSISKGKNICLGQSTTLEAQGALDYHWIPEESVTDPFKSSTTVSPSVTTEYSVIVTSALLNTVTGAPCEFTLTALVRVSELSKILPVGATANPGTVIAGNSSQLVYTGDPGAYVNWYPLNSTTPGTGYTVTAAPDKPTTYTVIANREACTEAVTVFVDVLSNTCIDKDVYIPNTFTPNGDGRNDIFRVQGLSVDQVYLAVYNRWGEKVYETSDKKGGWDGRYQNKDADVGVFGWYLKVKCYNGEETFRKGNVTLVR